MGIGNVIRKIVRQGAKAGAKEAAEEVKKALDGDKKEAPKK